MSYIQQSYKDILISKISIGIWIFYLFSFFNNWAQKWFYAGGWSDYFRTVGIVEFLFTFGIFIFQFFLIWRLLKPKKTNKTYTNFTINFHPVFKNPYEKKLFLIFTSFVFILFFDILPEELTIQFNPVTHAVIYYLISRWKSLRNSFPVNFMKSNSLRLIVKYQDYINHKIADDEPHLTINQNFDVTLKSLPRNDSEKNLIEIKNPNTPINPALVYNIKDKDLADALRGGYELRAKLIAIKRRREFRD